MKKLVTVHVGPSRVYINYGEIPPSIRFTVLSDLRSFNSTKLTHMKYNFNTKLYSVGGEFFLDDKSAQIMYFPKPALGWLTEFLETRNYNTELNQLENYATREVNYTNSPEWKPYPHQEEAIEYLIHHTGDRRGLELQTGSGKTCCANFTNMRLKQASMVVCGGLVEQWTEAIKEQMDVPDEALYVIKEFKTVKKLWDIPEDERPYLFVASWSTLRSYALGKGEYGNLPSYAEFVKQFGIGIKIVDEAHLALLATATIDMSADIPTNIYLTATFLTSDDMLRNIFFMYFPNQMKYVGDRVNHCDITCYSYGSKIPSNKTLNYGVYSHHKYEKIWFWNKRDILSPFVNNVLFKLIDRHYIPFEYNKPKKKLLIFFASKSTNHAIAGMLRNRYPHLIVNTYLAGDPKSILDESDIICSTHKKAGTGTDIKDLVCVINTVSFKAVTTAKQIVGRLRELIGYTPMFIDIHDYNNYYHNRHFLFLPLFCPV